MDTLERLSMLDDPKQFLSSLPSKPGVYQMYDVAGQILYVGKAKDLKKRLQSYFRAVDNLKTQVFMAQVKNIEIIITPDENAALLLESNLIKAKRPRYNILFKDDKSFPYLLLSNHDFPRLSVYRGAIDKVCGRYFGPFPDVSAVNFIVNLLQKIFQLRVCKDSFMCNRSRPCMLHQIKLCSAPCVGVVNKATYALQLDLAEQFLCNKSNYVVQKLTKLMDLAAARLDYEQAAIYRDQIASIRKVQAEQVMVKTGGDCDVIALMVKDEAVCINVLFVRNGLVLGNKNYFPKRYDLILSMADVLEAFIGHYYLQHGVNVIIPSKIVVNIKLPNRLAVAALLREKLGLKVILSDHVGGDKKQLIAMAETNALHALKTTYSQPSANNYSEGLLDFKKVFNLVTLPQRIECFDVSHTMGEAQTVSCVVFDQHGAVKEKYRRFNVKTGSAGDDYEALMDVLMRRYSSCKEMPEVIMVDGGVGQLGVASQVLRQLDIQDVILMAIAKGRERRPGLETIHICGKLDPVNLSPDRPALHFVQQIRDEAHRFAISGHRKKMVKARQSSKLENIVGVGQARRAALIRYFGGLTELQSAGIDDLTKVKGVSKNLAERIYGYLHGDGQ